MLLKLSIRAIHRAVEGSHDPITIQEYLEHFASFRPILGPVQISKYAGISDSKKITTFMLSPEYFDRNIFLATQHALYNLEWTFHTPEYDYGYAPDLTAKNIIHHPVNNEEGVVEWLTRSKVELSNVNQLIYSIEADILYGSLFDCEY
jgi:hypothetical protein